MKKARHTRPFWVSAKRFLKREYRVVITGLDWRFVPVLFGLFALIYVPALFGLHF